MNELPEIPWPPTNVKADPAVWRFAHELFMVFSERTGVGFVEARGALAAHGNAVEQAIDWLNKRGLASSAPPASSGSCYGKATPCAAVPDANVTPMRQPRADLARLVESINAAVYANGNGLSVTEAIGALELAKLELLKEQEQ